GDPAGASVAHGLVEPVMSEGEFVGAEPQGAAQELVAETDSEQWCARVEDPAYGGHRCVSRGWVTRATAEEDPVGPVRQDLLCGGRGRQHGDPATAFGKTPRRQIGRAHV